MGTEVLTPVDCLGGSKTAAKFYSGAAFTNRRKTTAAPRPAPAASPAPPRRTPSPKPKKLSRKSSPPPSSVASPSTEGFRLLKRGESFSPAQNPSDRTAQNNTRRSASDPAGSAEKQSILGRFNAESALSTPIRSRSGVVSPDPVVSFTQAGQIKPDQELTTPPGKTPARRIRSGAIYAGPAFTAASPEPSSLPLPSFLQKSSSMSSSSEDEASKALRCLLKLNIL